MGYTDCTRRSEAEVTPMNTVSGKERRRIFFLP